MTITTHSDVPASQVFCDLTVVDVSGSVATSYASKLFADYGASVINVEPPEGFHTRMLKPILSSGDSAMHAYLHANKYSVLASRSLFQDEPGESGHFRPSAPTKYGLSDGYRHQYLHGELVWPYRQVQPL